MVAFNDGPEIEFRRRSDPPIKSRKPVPPTQPHYENQPSPTSPAWYFLISLIVPGLGQLLLGSIFPAICWIITAGLGWYFFFDSQYELTFLIVVAHFGSAIFAAAKAKGDEVMQDTSHLFPSG